MIQIKILNISHVDAN